MFFFVDREDHGGVGWDQGIQRQAGSDEIPRSMVNFSRTL